MKQYNVLASVNVFDFNNDLNLAGAEGWYLVSSYAIKENGEDYCVGVLEKETDTQEDMHEDPSR